MDTSTDNLEQADSARYEFRVWGRHRRARRKLERFASARVDEQFDDCYLLVDDHSVNAKLRGRGLKLKVLVAEDHGFQFWATRRHRSTDELPEPFGTIFDEVGIELGKRIEPQALMAALAPLEARSGIRTVLVSKARRRYRIGDLRAEVTDVEVAGRRRRLRTLLIEGDDLEALVELRSRLGLTRSRNVPVHRAVGAYV